MTIVVFGTGYVGLVTAVCLAHIGHSVIGVDINEALVKRLNQGDCPLYEQGLAELLQQQLKTGRLQFSADAAFAIHQSALHVVATGTPGLDDGQADLSQVHAVVDAIAMHAHHDGLLVIKSTVPVGSGHQIEQRLMQGLAKQGNSAHIAVVSNPEFLREGCAVADFLYPDRIILGGETARMEPLRQVYQPLLERGVPLLCMSRESAELSKYAANAMLACRISFINQISQIAEKTGASIDEISLGVGSDHRIGPHFLQAGIGYGGSCFPKDVKALCQTAESLGIKVPLLTSIETANEQQKQWVIQQLKQHFGPNLVDKTIGVWGLAFKPGTDDLRDAISVDVIRQLLTCGVRLQLYDPVVNETTQRCIPKNSAVSWGLTAEALFESPLDALVIMTEWDVFKTYDLNQLRRYLGQAPLIDARNCFELSAITAAQFSYYYSVGRPQIRCSEPPNLS